MTTNPVFGEFEGCQPGETGISVLGMATENFTNESVEKIRKLIAEHGIQDKLVFLKNDYNYWLVDKDAIQPAELSETTDIFSYDDEDDAEEILQRSKHQLLLNLDDEDEFMTNDEVIPTTFMHDLLLALAEIGEVEPDEYVISMWRKGFLIDSTEDEPTWEDYEELLALHSHH